MKRAKVIDISTPGNNARVLRKEILKTKLRLFGAYARRDIAKAAIRYHEWRIKKIKGE